MILKATFRRPARQDLDLPNLPGKMPRLSDVKLLKYDEDGWTAEARRNDGSDQGRDPDDPLDARQPRSAGRSNRCR